MIVRYIPADPAGNLTGLVLTGVAPEARAALAAHMMASCPEGLEQIAFVDASSLLGALPRMDMMGGEFCGNATRAFALLAARCRGKGEQALCVSVSGAAEPVWVTLDAARGRAYADMPLPQGLSMLTVDGRSVPVVRMEGIAHALLMDTAPSPELAQRVLRAMPREDAQGVIFVEGTRMTPLVYVEATGTSVWERSCGSGTVALGWYLTQNAADGMHARTFDEPGGQLSVQLTREHGRTVRVQMGGDVTLGAEREIEI